METRAQCSPERRAFAFVDGDATVELSHRELERYARSFALELATETRRGDRALLLYPPGPAYLIAFFGCLLAGVIPVPLYPPPAHRTVERLRAILIDAGATLALTDHAFAGRLAAKEGKLIPGVRVRTIDTFGAATGDLAAPASDDVALLQYTSGSTGSPKGVVVTHRNILANAAIVREAFGLSPDDVSVSWLPPYHDMGLIGSTLTPLVTGFPAVFMTPLAFLRRPLSWLKTIARFGGTIGGAPNFAYALCVAKHKPELVERWDLSAWRVAFTGAEPVRSVTIDQFSRTFAPWGFRRESFHPCYGLAESTLLVSGLPTAAAPITIALDGAELAAGRVVPATTANARIVVSCGKPPGAVHVVIADPQTCSRLPSGGIGEIWVASPSNARGYWRRPDDQTFRALLSDGDGPYLRTGDTGFLLDGNLFVIGRCKEVIIINGRNFYPRDIEEIGCQAYPALDPDGSVAFSIVVQDREAVVFAAELRSADATVHRDAAAAVRAALLRELDVALQDVHFVAPGAIPRTSSGKLRRLAMRDAYVAEVAVR